MARSFTDALGFLVRYLVQQAHNLPANSVRPANQKVPTGAEGNEFATVLLKTIDSDFGSYSMDYVPDPATGSTNVIETLDNIYRFTCSIQFFRHAAPVNDAMGISPFGMGAFDKAARLGVVLSSSPMMALMGQMGLGLEGLSPPQNLAFLMDGSRWEDRGSVDATFTVENRESISIATIGSLEVDLKFQRQDGTIVSTTVTATQPEVTP